MRCACVDIGTNTTRLLVAEHVDGRLREVVAVRRFLRLRPDADGTIAPAAVGDLAAAVGAQARLAREHSASTLRVVGTAALRQAVNRDDVCRAVGGATGARVEVLDPGEEAALSFAGALHGAPVPGARAVGVIDIGGGSSELVVGAPGGAVAWWASFAVGSGVLTDRHVRSDPPAPEELAATRAAAEEALAGVSPPAAEVVLAIGGSATALAGSGGRLRQETIARALAILTAEPAARAAHRLGMQPERARTLPAGLLLLEAAWNAFAGAPLRVTRGGLREGVVLQALQRHRGRS